MTFAECRSELVVRERRGALSETERTALAAHLLTCESCRLSHQLGRDFDRGATLEPEDGIRIAKLGIAARRWAESGAPRPTTTHARKKRRLGAWLMAATVCFAAMSASAAAGFWVSQSDVFSEPEASEVAPTPAKPPPARRAAPAELGAASLPSAQPEPEPVPVPVARAETTPARAEPPSTAKAASPAAPETARSLFQAANAARRAGQRDQALSLYRRLEREFPASPEARLSRLRQGSLLLGAGDSAGALAAFDRYLASANGALTPEALYGRGRALAALGRTSEERETWRRLLEQFGTSPYAAHARRRLGVAAPEPSAGR